MIGSSTYLHLSSEAEKFGNIVVVSNSWFLCDIASIFVDKYLMGYQFFVRAAWEKSPAGLFWSVIFISAPIRSSQCYATGSHSRLFLQVKSKRLRVWTDVPANSTSPLIPILQWLRIACRAAICPFFVPFKHVMEFGVCVLNKEKYV